jgi:alkylated DNA repair dioxygenase AlkB
MFSIPENARVVVPGMVSIIERWLCPNHSDLYSEKIIEETCDKWKGQMAFSRGRRWFDKEHCMARFGDENVTYSYKGKEKPVHQWTETLGVIRDKLACDFDWNPNCVVLNSYGPSSSLYPHRDSTYIPQLGEDPIIIGVSFGCTRTFNLYKNDSKKPDIGIQLRHGDLLVMHGKCDSVFKHGISDESGTCENAIRVSLTFRKHIV